MTTSLVFSSCTDKVGDNEFNTIKNGSTSTKVTDAATAVGLLQGAMPLVHDSREHKYQYQFNLHIDNYAGYLVMANKLQGRLPRTLSPHADFETGPHANLLWVARQVVPVMNSAEELQRPELGAIGAILYNFSASEYVDVHGPMPYTAYRNLQSEPPVKYEKVSDVYKMIIADLKKQQQILKDLGTLPAEHQADLTRFDRLAGGRLENWIGFANAIRARMAMRMVNVDPDLAKQEFESAVADGLLTENIRLADIGRHPLFIISEDWDDTRLNANFENLLSRLHHPALKAWFKPIPAGFKDMNGVVTVPADRNEVFAGMRAGMSTYAKEESEFSRSYKHFSGINSSYSIKPIYIFKRSEVQFLLAEAALRGWNNGGVAVATAYGRGVSYFFADEGLEGLTTYMRQTPEQCPQLDYVDYYNSYYNSPAAENGSAELGVAWNNAYSNEKKLEMIITQKYICNYPLSLEAWSDYRRTGYPVMISIHPDDSGDGSIPPAGWTAPAGEPQPDRMIHRIPFVKTGSVSLNDIITSAIPALQAEDKSLFKGRDYQASHLWWDTPTANNFQ